MLHHSLYQSALARNHSCRDSHDIRNIFHRVFACIPSGSLRDRTFRASQLRQTSKSPTLHTYLLSDDVHTIPPSHLHIFCRAISSYEKEFRYGWRYCIFCFSVLPARQEVGQAFSFSSIYYAGHNSSCFVPLPLRLLFVLDLLFFRSIPPTQCILFSDLLACARLRSLGLRLGLQ